MLMLLPLKSQGIFLRMDKKSRYSGAEVPGWAPTGTNRDEPIERRDPQVMNGPEITMNLVQAVEVIKLAMKSVETSLGQSKPNLRLSLTGPSKMLVKKKFNNVFFTHADVTISCSYLGKPTLSGNSRNKVLFISPDEEDEKQLKLSIVTKVESFGNDAKINLPPGFVANPKKGEIHNLIVQTFGLKAD